MKNLLKRVPKSVYAAVATIAIVAGVASQAIAGFGPDRPTRPWTAAENGFDHVTFNSYTGVPNGIGDEREFFRGVQVGRDGNWIDPVNGVEQGAEVEMKIFIHNNADPLLNDKPGAPGVAKNVRVRADLPTGASQSHQATAYISADNAQPKEIFDTLDMTGANAGFFELAFVPGSAKMYNHENGQTTAIGDDLVTTGVNIGDQKGCFKYVREITFRVKVKMPHYKVNKQVRFEGQTKNDWKENLNAKSGQTVEWKIEFDNVGATLLKDVIILDQVPEGVTVVPNSVKLIDGNFPQGYEYGDEAVQNNGRQVNVNIGNVNPGINSIVTFKTKVNSDIECGVHKLVNTAYATPGGYGTIKDNASVTVDGGECKEEKPVYACEAIKVEKLGGRKVRVNVTAPASGGASLKVVTINYGDGSEPKVTNNLTDEYEFKADGTFKISASATFNVNGTDKTVTSDACNAMVTFEAGKPTPETPELPKTGSGSVIGVFVAVTAAVAAAHSVLSRRTV